jgi:hypothetical protein
MHIRDETLIAAYPLSDAAAFNSRPRLISSVAVDSVDTRAFARVSGDWLPFDTFYLMSDAIACWFFEQVAACERPWEILRNLGTSEMPPFPKWLDELRNERAIKNDDVTVLRIFVSPDIR